MSGISPAPFKLTDGAISDVLSSNTVSAKLTDAGIAAALSSATVGAKMAQTAAGAIGTVALLLHQGTATLNPGDTVPGSQCGYANNNGWTGSNISGTWQCRGYKVGSGQITTFLRIA